MSIHQQKKMKFEEEEREKKEKAKAEKAEKRRQEIIEQQRSVHMRSEENYVIQGPASKPTPYGSWQTVEPKIDLPEAPVDYQVPTVKEAPQANVTLHSDRFTKFEEKKTPSLGGNSSTGSSSKPAIVFRKRKINDEHRKNARRRDENE